MKVGQLVVLEDVDGVEAGREGCIMGARDDMLTVGCQSSCRTVAAGKFAARNCASTVENARGFRILIGCFNHEIDFLSKFDNREEIRRQIRSAEKGNGRLVLVSSDLIIGQQLKTFYSIRQNRGIDATACR